MVPNTASHGGYFIQGLAMCPGILGPIVLETTGADFKFENTQFVIFTAQRQVINESQ